MKNYYEILNVDSTCNIKEIKRNYLKLVQLYHPDKNNNQSKDLFLEIQTAFEHLNNIENRKEYDLKLLNDTKNKELLDGKISDLIDINDMEYNDSLDEFNYQCRCSDYYTIKVDELKNGYNILNCNGCSLIIKIKIDL